MAVLIHLVKYIHSKQTQETFSAIIFHLAGICQFKFLMYQKRRQRELKQMHWNISETASMLTEWMLSMNCVRKQNYKRNWPRKPKKHSSITSPGPMWICCWRSLMKRMIDLETAYKERIAAWQGGDVSLSKQKRFTIAQPQIFLCYPGHFVHMGLGAEASTSTKTTRFPERKTDGFVNLGTRWHCLQGYKTNSLWGLLLW